MANRNFKGAADHAPVQPDQMTPIIAKSGTGFWRTLEASRRIRGGMDTCFQTLAVNGCWFTTQQGKGMLAKACPSESKCTGERARPSFRAFEKPSPVSSSRWGEQVPAHLWLTGWIRCWHAR